MDPKTAAEVYRQIVDGDDIPKIAFLLKRMSSERATLKQAGWPYSILTNLQHADFWQRVWLGRLNGTKRPSVVKDWREPEPSEFEAIRDSFLSNLAMAHELASRDPFQHKMSDDDTAVKTLIALAVHDAYHIGQIKLLATIATLTEVD